jgi:hypothetical protein
MNLARLKMLEEFMKEEPGNPFNIYALALEYLGLDRARSGVLFEVLLSDHPRYVPTYYHAGNFYLEQGYTDKAFQIFTTGLEMARLAGDKKAEGEIRAMMDNLD